MLVDINLKLPRAVQIENNSMADAVWRVCVKWASVVPTWQTASESVLSQSEFVSVTGRVLEPGMETRRSSLCSPLFTSSGILHGLHSDEALPALRPGQQSLLLPSAAWRRTLPPQPAVHLASSAQIPNEHAGEEPNGHGWHAVPSTAGMLANASAPPPREGHRVVACVTCSLP